MLGYLLNPALQLEDINGLPLVGGWLTVYRAGTTFPYITYRDFDMNRNPVNIVLDEKGMAVILAESDGNYDVYAYDRNGVQQWSRLNVCTIGAGGSEPPEHTRSVHRLLRYFTNASDADENHPVGDWLHDLDSIDPEDPSGHPMVTADELFYWYEAGQNFELYEVDGTNGQLGWSAIYRMVTWQDQSEWWSQYAETPGKACRLEFFRMGMYSTPYRGGLIAYIRYKDEDYMRLYEIKSGQSIWMAEYQEKLPYYSYNWHNGDYLKVKNDGSGLEWSAVNVPTATSQLTNDSGFITSADLPSVGNGTITIQKNSTDVDSFTTNQSSNKTINITVPTKTSDLTNDSNFVTSSDLPTVNDGTLTLQVNGVDLQTFSANSATNKTANIIIPPECYVYVATYNVSTWAEVKAAYDAGKVIVLEGANFGSNVHTQMLMYNYSTTTGQTERFYFAPTINQRVATASKYWAILDENAGWTSGYYSNAYPNISYGVFQLNGDETARSLVEHRGYLSNNVFNFDVKYFSSLNACNIYIGYVDQPLEFDVIGTRRLIRNDLKRAASSSTTVYDLVNNIDKTDRIIINAQALNSANPRIDIATLGPQEQSLSSADIYWDLDLLVRQSGVLGGLSSGFHLHIEKYGNESTNNNYIFGTIAGTDLR
jgi:hypothetical protein